MAPHPGSVRIVYFDKGKSSWSLMYDAINNPGKKALNVKKQNTNQWKEITVKINDARFEKVGYKNSDLCIVHKKGKEIIFHLPEIKGEIKN